MRRSSSRRCCASRHFRCSRSRGASTTHDGTRLMAADAPKIERGEAVALVLGAGGARGFAQIGVIEPLQERGLHSAAVAGSSSGALVGGLYASGQLPVFRDWLLAMSRTDMLRLLESALGGSALFGGEA